MFNIVLFEPEIPQNTGNIARLCAGSLCRLHLVKPLGFSLEDRYLKRAGLDYWHLVEIVCHNCFEDLRREYLQNRFFYFSTKGRRYYSDCEYKPDDFLVFGSETRGLPEKIILNNSESVFRIPLVTGARSLNLSNSVAIVVYEGLSQHMFRGLS